MRMLRKKYITEYIPTLIMVDNITIIIIIIIIKYFFNMIRSVKINSE